MKIKGTVNPKFGYSSCNEFDIELEIPGALFAQKSSQETNVVSFEEVLKKAVPCMWRKRDVGRNKESFGKWKPGLFLGYLIGIHGAEYNGGIVYDEKTRRHILVYTPTQLKMGKG